MVEVILPVLDEAGSLPWVLGRMPTGYEPIVIDNGSTDGSAQVAADLGVRVVTEPRRGFGAACYAGLVAATSDVVCFLDADGSLDPADLPAVADPVIGGARDLVLGARSAEPGAWPVHGRVANRVLAHRLRHASGVDLSDLGPMRAATRQSLLELGIGDRRFGWPLEMVVRAAAAGWQIDEVTVPYRPRRAGRSKVTGTIGGTIRAVRDMEEVFRTCT